MLHLLLVCYWAIQSNAQFITGFTTPGSLTNWVYYNGSEFPGAVGNLTLGTNLAQLTYDFNQRPPSGTWNPQYIEAYIDFQVSGITVFSNSTTLQFAVRTHNSAVTVRLVDNTYQTFQFSNLFGVASHVLPLEQSSPSYTSDWNTITVAIGASGSFWGGAGDGTFHGPLKQVAILCQGTQNQTGFLAFTNVTLIPTPPVSLPVYDVSAPNKFISPFYPDLGTLQSKAGVNIHFTNNSKVMDIIKNAHLGWIRMDFCWGCIEYVKGVYNFNEFDGLVNAARSRGLKIVAILDYGNALYTAGAMVPPITPAEILGFTNYVNAIVSHYQADNSMIIYEVWNEPDIPGFWQNLPNASQYSTLLKATLAAVHAADPNAFVLTGGMANPESGAPFWSLLQSTGAMQGANGLGTHLYTPYSTYPEYRWVDIIHLQELAASENIGVVWCTEWGRSVVDIPGSTGGNDAMALNMQAVYFARQLMVTWWSNLPINIMYDIYNDGPNLTYNEHNFGLLYADFTDKPSMVAVRTLGVFALGRTFSGLLTWPGSSDSLVHVAKLTGSSDTVFVAWTENVQATIAFPLTATATSMLGAPISPTVANGLNNVNIQASSGLVYITVPTPTSAPVNPTSPPVVGVPIAPTPVAPTVPTAPTAPIAPTPVSPTVPTVPTASSAPTTPNANPTVTSAPTTTAPTTAPTAACWTLPQIFSDFGSRNNSILASWNSDIQMQSNALTISSVISTTTPFVVQISFTSQLTIDQVEVVCQVIQRELDADYDQATVCWVYSCGELTKKRQSSGSTITFSLDGSTSGGPPFWVWIIVALVLLLLVVIIVGAVIFVFKNDKNTERV